MNVILLSALILFSTISLFLAFNFIVRPILRALLNGPFNDLFLDYLKTNTKFNVDEAFAAHNSKRAWNEIVFTKVYELGITRVPYSKREQNLKYIKEASLPSRKLLDELIKVLPKQYRNQDFQAKLACYICELAGMLGSAIGNSKTQPMTPISKIVINDWGIAISAWMAGIVYLALSLSFTYEQYLPTLLLLANIIFVCLMIAPLFLLIRNRLARFRDILTVIAVIVLILGTYAALVHGKTKPKLEIDLSSYQNPDVSLLVRYPEWLSINNVGCNGKKVSIILNDKLVAPIKFRVDDSQFYFINEDCREIIPQIDVVQPVNEAYEFYIIAKDDTPFWDGQKSIQIIPQYIVSSGYVDFSDADRMLILIENWSWGLVNNLSVQFAPISIMVVWYLVNLTFRKRI